ncbi:stage II sporulation protein P [Polycladomyces subterraneus]|uniref:Stage II sporulation protein P n=1 Tax=Polycladomyces subterraneus TaxID=1016997 RepID=A0ABT8IPU8_9BACL|nr:stage II sporulation protein P [Polycladomyces subterraneus]MDN4594777.1 stage II sporulation protein P [Polycladomyces subterraneus]
MRHRYRGFATLNMSGPRERQSFVLLILGTALVFIFTGAFAMLEAERSAHSSDIGRLTTHLSADTLLWAMGREIPYLATMRDKQDDGRMSRLFFELATSIDPKDPRTFIGRELPGFSLFDTEIVVAGKGVKYTDVPIESEPPPDLAKELERQSERVKDHTPSDRVDKPSPSSSVKRVFIYQTHFSESYLPDLGRRDPDMAYDWDKNVIMVGKRLGEELERLGIGTEVSTAHYKEPHPKLYRSSRKTVLAAMRQNQDLQYFIDIHRDSQRRDKTTTTIDGKPYARISFVIGTAHEDWEQNLKLARQLHNKLESLYPGLSKGVFLKNRATGNGEYNQSLSPRSILVEIGGVDNSFVEVFRTTKALARAFADLYFQTEPVDARTSAPSGSR